LHITSASGIVDSSTHNTGALMMRLYSLSRWAFLGIVPLLLLTGCAPHSTFERSPLPDDRTYDFDLSATAGGAESELPSMPEPIGGMRGIQDEVRYPPSARRARVEGQVRLQFVVAPDGKTYNVEVTDLIGIPADTDAAALDDLQYEAKRVIYASTWKPGMRAGERVPVRMSWPVTFRSR